MSFGYAKFMCSGFSLAFSIQDIYMKHSPSCGIKAGVNESLCKMLEVSNSKHLALNSFSPAQKVVPIATLMVGQYRKQGKRRFNMLPEKAPLAVQQGKYYGQPQGYAFSWASRA